MATGDDAESHLLSEQQSQAADVEDTEAPQEAEAECAEVDQLKVGAQSVAEPCALCATTDEQTSACVGCQLHAHPSCYGDSKSSDRSEGDANWRCDLCASGVDRAEIKCAYCCQSEGGLPMRSVTMPQQQQQGDADDVVMAEETTAYAHFLCIEWDPEALSAEETHAPKPATQRDDPNEHQTAAEAQARTTKPVVISGQDGIGDDPRRPCCFCQSSAGVRIQCRQVNCVRYFHAMCCSQQSNGRLEHASASAPLAPQRIAYCDRHRDETASITDLLEKLVSKQMSSLVGSKAVKQFQSMQRKMKQQGSPNALLGDIIAILVDVCRQGLQASTSDPPMYETKHLQALQFVLNYLPQLQRVYPSSIDSKQAHEWVDDASLKQQLVATFDPARYVSKYAGPATQQQACHVCHEPFQQRQHVFYCVSETTPHAQHWKCTKRKSTSREREKQMSSGSAKKKLKSITMVQNGAWHDVHLPKGLPSVSDDVICSICRCAIDASGLIASRGEAKSMAFAKKESVFAHNGCFVNTLSGHSARHAAFAATKAAAAAARAGSTVTGAKQADNRNIRRANSTSSVEPAKASSSVGIAAAPDVPAIPVLAPPKMERINVQRTLRWLACIAQIIRIVRAHAAKEKSVDEGDAAEPMEVESGDNKHADIAETAEQPPVSVPAPSLMDQVDVYFEEAKTVVGSYDVYVLDKLETAREMLRNRSGPALAVLNLVAQEYTRFMHIKHTRAVEKAAAEKRKREEEEAQELREQERKRLEREAELTLKAQMLAMRKQQRKQQQTKQSAT